MAKRLLIIDDEPAISEFVNTVATGLGFEVKVTDDPQAFLSLAKEFEPDVIVLDIVMPETDGIELLTELSRTECRARILVISGYGEHYLSTAESLSSAFGLSQVQTLRKPIRLNDLRKALVGEDGEAEAEADAEADAEAN